MSDLSRESQFSRQIAIGGPLPDITTFASGKIDFTNVHLSMDQPIDYYEGTNFVCSTCKKIFKHQCGQCMTNDINEAIAAIKSDIEKINQILSQILSSK